MVYGFIKKSNCSQKFKLEEKNMLYIELWTDMDYS